jgi:hypothetical protein
MDRNLEIALVAGALAIAWGYGLSQRLKHGDTQIQFMMIYRDDNPGAFWTIMVLLGIILTGLVGLTVVHLAMWLGAL